MGLAQEPPRLFKASYQQPSAKPTDETRMHVYVLSDVAEVIEFFRFLGVDLTFFVLGVEVEFLATTTIESVSSTLPLGRLAGESRSPFVLSHDAFRGKKKISQ